MHLASMTLCHIMLNCSIHNKYVDNHRSSDNNQHNNIKIITLFCIPVVIKSERRRIVIRNKNLYEIAKLRSIDILSRMLLIGLPFFESSRIYRVSARKIKNELNAESIDISRKISYLKKMGYIEYFLEGKEAFWEITKKGKDKFERYQILNPVISKPSKWDGKWRVVIFDVPNKNKTRRDGFRRKIVELGFEKVQESVYVYPFECALAVSNLAELYMISNNVLIMISEVIQGEANIIEKFIDKNILSKRDIKRE